MYVYVFIITMKCKQLKIVLIKTRGKEQNVKVRNKGTFFDIEGDVLL
jgi:hypothetical protein